jgi:arsenate reductase
MREFKGEHHDCFSQLLRHHASGFHAPRTMSKSKVLFLCTANSARSQMAEALLRRHAGDRYEPLSAGMEPTTVHSLAIRAMSEIGIDISGQRSKSVKEYLGRVALGHVIFVCARAEKNCPYLYPPLAPESWPFEDPAAGQGTEEECLEKFRHVRDQIEARIKTWLAADP